MHETIFEPSPAASQLPLPEGEAVAADDRDNIKEGDSSLLIVDPDRASAEYLLGLAREQGFKGIIAARLDDVMALARDFKLQGIVLRSDSEGWIIFDRLKRTLDTRHIPVEIIGDPRERQRALSMGAFGFIQKGSSENTFVTALASVKQFADRGVKNLLIVEDNAAQRNAILELIGNGDVRCVAVGTGEEALEQLRSIHFHCIVLDLGLPDMPGFDLLERIKKELGLFDLPVIVYTAMELSSKDETRLRTLSESLIIKDTRSPERLLAETVLFLHRPASKLSPAKRKMLEQQQRTDPALAGKKVLVIDDDVRNIFSITSLLERYHMEVVFAENGRDGIDLLKHTPDVDAILVDIMMPDIDGYETIGEIRNMSRSKSTPIIVVTAKAMKDNRERCIAAGATDYISKPADVDRLLSLLRLHLGN
jgi:CheY-like chemotaxis protein